MILRRVSYLLATALALCHLTAGCHPATVVEEVDILCWEHPEHGSYSFVLESRWEPKPGADMGEVPYAVTFEGGQSYVTPTLAVVTSDYQQPYTHGKKVGDCFPRDEVFEGWVSVLKQDTRNRIFGEELPERLIGGERARGVTYRAVRDGLFMEVWLVPRPDAIWQIFLFPGEGETVVSEELYRMLDSFQWIAPSRLPTASES